MKPSPFCAAALCFCVAAPSSLFADFQYQEKTQITGGAMVGMMKLAGAFSSQARQANEPILSSVYVKGNRMARVNRLSTEIIDLDRETITHIDHVKKQYSTMTFEQMKQQMQEMEQKAKEEQAKQTHSGQTPPNNTEMNFAVKVRNTDATKDVAGLTAKEAIMAMTLEGRDKTTGRTGAMAITNDMWMAPEIPGYSEVRDFYVRYAKKMGTVFGGSITPQMFAMQPGMSKGMEQMATEMSKLKGVPVYQVMRMGTTANGQALPAASEAPLPPTPDVAMPSAQDVAANATDTAADDAQQSAANKVANKMGGFGNIASGLPGFGGFGHKKKTSRPPEQTANQTPAATNTQAANTAGPAVLLESTTELTSFSKEAVEDSRFDVPAGYQQVTRDLHGSH